MAASLPAGLVAYRRTPVFDQDSLPAGLRREHRTKPGTWALIHVLEGRLAYRTFSPDAIETLMPGAPGLIRPEQPHEVEPLGPVRIFVEFHARMPGATHEPSAAAEPVAWQDGAVAGSR